MVNGFGTWKLSLVCRWKIPLNVSSNLTQFIKRRIVFLKGRYRKGYVAHIEGTFTERVEVSGAHG
jgi:hypothetical protein